MTQIKSGLRSVLEIPSIYSFFQKLVGANKSYTLITNSCIKPFENMRVLDIGCGPADILKYLPKNITYVGFDFEESYIKANKVNYPQHTFICDDVTNFDLNASDKFDRIFLFGILHHLEDSQVEKILSFSVKLLTENGFIVNLENAFVENQNLIAKKIIQMDRGQNVRSPEGYLHFYNGKFRDVQYEIRTDLLHIPYTHILITAK